MKKIAIQDFIDKSNIEIIQELMQVNNGYVTSKLITELGIHRMYLKQMIKCGLIEKVGKGIYIDKRKIKDEYYIFSLENPKIVYSHMTALYFFHLAKRAPYQVYDISIPAKYHNDKLNKHNIFYVANDYYDLGLTEIETPLGNKVKVYDVERCICDIFKNRRRMDLDLIKYSIRYYLKI